jgi:membrane-associated protein
MEYIKKFIDLFLHLDKYLNVLIQNYGIWTYLILFLVIFCETGLVVTPLLPGDSLLFAAGAFASKGSLNIIVLIILLGIAAILGDSLNYFIGYKIGPKVFKEKNSKFFKQEYLIKTQNFYEKHGGKTIIIARFMPIIRTFAPFVAGIGKMSYSKFIAYNIIGGILWVTLFLLAGYFFSQISFVEKNFSLVIFAVIFISIMPGIIEYIKHKMKS